MGVSEKQLTMTQKTSDHAAQQRLAWLSQLSRVTLAIEFFCPPALLLLSLWIGLLGLIWLGLFLILPTPWNGSAILIGLLATLLMIGLALRARQGLLQWPSKRDALFRLDQDFKNRPASSFGDPLALSANDPLTEALWQKHRAQLAASIMQLSCAPPRIIMSRLDPCALRHLAVLILVTGFFAAGAERPERLWAATSFQWSHTNTIALREDGWIDPPAYTQIAPIILDLATFKDGDQPLYTVPTGSVLVLRRSGGDTISTTIKGPLVLIPNDQNTSQHEQDLRFKISGDAQLQVALLGRRSVDFHFTALADKPPTIKLIKAPVAEGQESLLITYGWQDDYGIAQGFVDITGIVEDGQIIRHPPLLDPPRAALSFMPDQRRGETKQPLGYEEHLWSGLTVEARLSVHDDVQQNGLSETFRFTLPQRLFTHPLARALDEQRKLLVRAPHQQKKVLMALEALMVAPDLFTPQFGPYLGLNRARRWLSRPADKARLIETAQWLWDMAVMIETEGSDDAQKALQAAQAALKEAIAREAPAHELKQLSEAVRQAMNRLLLALTDQMRKQDPSQNDLSKREGGQTITPQDLSALMDKLDQAMQRGDQEEALRLLEQLRQITRNLQTARPDGQASPSDQQRALGALQDMTRDQQNLRDKTYREGLERQQDRQRPRSEQKADPDGPLSDLENNQKALRDKLDALRQGMQQNGADQDGFADADSAMREAEEALKQGQDSDALDAQNRAIQGLRQGADQLAKYLRQQNGDGDTGQNQEEADRQNGQGDNGQNSNGRDPLGRPLPSQGSNDRARMQGDGLQSAPEQRARALLEELRRRLGELDRPQAEIDYLKRLLQSDGLNAKP